MLPDWREELRRCAEEWQMPGIRLHPNYHNYKLSDPAFRDLLELAGDHSLIVQVAAWMEDERHHHQLLRVPEVDLGPLAAALEPLADLQVVVANGYRSPGGSSLDSLRELPGVTFDFAKLDVYDGLAEFIKATSARQIVFGSHSPMYYFESTALKMQESVLTDDQLNAICHENAERVVSLRSGMRS